MDEWSRSRDQFFFLGRVVGVASRWFGAGGRVAISLSRPSDWPFSLPIEWLITFFGGPVVDHFLMIIEWLSLLVGRVLIFLHECQVLGVEKAWRGHIIEFKSPKSGLGPLYYDSPCAFLLSGCRFNLVKMAA